MELTTDVPRPVTEDPPTVGSTSDQTKEPCKYPFQSRRSGRTS